MVSLVNVTSLTLSICPTCENLPSLGKMVSLEFLCVEVMDSLKRAGAEFFEATETDQVNVIVDPTSKSSVVSFPRLKLTSI